MSQVIAPSLALPVPAKALVLEPIIGETYAQVQAVLNRMFGRLVASMAGWVAQTSNDGSAEVPWKTSSATLTSINDNPGLNLHDIQGAPIFKRKVGTDATERHGVLLAHLSGAQLDVDLIPWAGGPSLSFSVSQAPDVWAWVAQVVVFNESQTDDFSGPIPMQVDARGARLGTEALIAQWALFEAFLTTTTDMPI